MSAHVPTETEHLPTTTQRQAARPLRNSEDALRFLRQLMAQGARVVRLGRRRGRPDSSSA